MCFGPVSVLEDGVCASEDGGAEGRGRREVHGEGKRVVPAFGSESGGNMILAGERYRLVGGW